MVLAVRNPDKGTQAAAHMPGRTEVRELDVKAEGIQGNVSCRSDASRSINWLTHPTVGRIEIGNGDRFGVRVWGAP